MNPLKFLSPAALSLSILLSATSAHAAFDTIASYAYMVDDTTGAVLLNKNGEEQMHPSSMSKLMTVYLLLDQIKQGHLTPDDTFPVSEKAWKMQGSKMFVGVGENVSVQNLLQGIIVQSGNDACIVVAEGLRGDENTFAEALNAKAKEIGMTGSHFVNSTGWPDENHLMTPKDLATLTHHLIHDFPEQYAVFKELEFTYNGIRQPNRNLLLTRNIGVDGLKTGHTEAAGYGITISAKQGDRRLILVVNGLKNERERASEAERLLLYGFRNFTNKTLFVRKDKIAEADVWYGKASKVGLISKDDLTITVPKNNIKDVKAKVVYNSPIPAPIKAGDHIADLVVTVPNMADQTIKLYAEKDVAKTSWLGRVFKNAWYYIAGK